MSILYQPQYRVHGTSTWINWGSPTVNTSITIGASPPGPALSPLTQYDFQVVATNSVGSISLPAISATTPASGSVQTVALSPQTFVVGGAAGTSVGTVTVTLSSGTFNGSLTVTGADAAIFQSPITGGTLRLSGATTTARTYNINIVATQSGLANSPFTQSFANITGTAGQTSVVPDTRPQAVKNAGYNTIVFFDDFTTGVGPGTTVTTDYSQRSGYNWYPANDGNKVLAQPTNFEVRTTALASSVANAGTAASTNGGLMVMKGAGSPGTGLALNNQFQTVPNATQFTATPGGQIWKHAYFEAYMWYDPTKFTQWSFPMAWWSYPVVSNSGSNGIEVDFFEQGNTNGLTGNAVGIVDPPSVTARGNFLWPTMNTSFHTFGALWESTGANTGRWSAWYDGVQMTTQNPTSGALYVTTGTGGTAPDGENGGGNAMVLGSTLGNTPLYIDWIRVWQAP